MISLRYQKGNEEYEVLRFQGSQTIIYEPHLRTVMEQAGITVPHAYKQDFNHQKTVKLGDPLFQRAFKEIYYPLVLDPTLFIWCSE